MCDNLKISGLGEDIKNKTGLVIDAYFSGKPALNQVMPRTPMEQAALY